MLSKWSFSVQIRILLSGIKKTLCYTLGRYDRDASIQEDYSYKDVINIYFYYSNYKTKHDKTGFPN